MKKFTAREIAAILFLLQGLDERGIIAISTALEAEINYSLIEHRKKFALLKGGAIDA